MPVRYLALVTTGQRLGSGSEVQVTLCGEGDHGRFEDVVLEQPLWAAAGTTCAGVFDAPDVGRLVSIQVQVSDAPELTWLLESVLIAREGGDGRGLSVAFLLGLFRPGDGLEELRTALGDHWCLEEEIEQILARLPPHTSSLTFADLATAASGVLFEAAHVSLFRFMAWFISPDSLIASASVQTTRVSELSGLDPNVFDTAAAQLRSDAQRAIDAPVSGLSGAEADTALRLLRGDHQVAPAMAKRDVRVFTSSTFTDTADVRNLLMAGGYPVLAQTCRVLGSSTCAGEFGTSVDVVDTDDECRGVTDDNHGTSAMCMKEIASCLDNSAATAFITMLCDKSGYRPFPARIERRLFEDIRARGVQLELADIALLDDGEGKWWRLDENAVPAEYELQPKSSLLPDLLSDDATLRRAAGNTWWGIFEGMQRVLRASALSLASQGTIPHDVAARFVQAVTAEETVHGIVRNPRAEQNAWLVRRAFRNPTVQPGEDNARLFIDMADGQPDTEALELLRVLKDTTLPERLPTHRVLDFELPWVAGGINVEKVIGQDIVAAWLRDNKSPRDELVDEVSHHVMLRTAKCKVFVGREAELDSIGTYAARITTSDPSTPLVVHGPSGVGKTALIARASLNVATRFENGIHIVRFLGTSAGSATGRSLLSSLCAQLSEAMGGDRADAATTYKEAATQLPLLLQRATETRPIVLFLDSVDQLADENDARGLGWVPVQLPPHVAIIISTLPDVGGCLEAAKSLISDTSTSPKRRCLSTRVSSCTMDPHRRSYLGLFGRQLTEEQRTSVVNTPGVTWLPLYINLVVREVKTWSGFMGSLVLPPTVPGLINRLYQRLERVHGPTHPPNVITYRFVVHAAHDCSMTHPRPCPRLSRARTADGTCAYSNRLHVIRLAPTHTRPAEKGDAAQASREGLSTNEVEDLLSLDDVVLNDVFEWWTPPIRRLPPSLWVRLARDLEEFLVERGSVGGGTVSAWFHRQFHEASARRYLGQQIGTVVEADDALTAEQRGVCLTTRAAHAAIARYLQGVWYGVAKPFVSKNGTAGSADRRVADHTSWTLTPTSVWSDGAQLNHRRLSELVHHLIAAEEWGDEHGPLASTLCDLDYVRGKIISGQLAALQLEYVNALAKQPSGWAPRRNVMAFRQFLGKNSAVYMKNKARTLLQDALNSPGASAIAAAGARVLARTGPCTPLLLVAPECRGEEDRCRLAFEEFYDTEGEYTGMDDVVQVAQCGGVLVTTHLIGLVIVWDFNTGARKRVFRGPQMKVPSLAFAPPGGVFGDVPTFAWSAGNEVVITNANTGETLQLKPGGRDETVVYLAFDEQGGKLLAVDGPDLVAAPAWRGRPGGRAPPPTFARFWDLKAQESRTLNEFETAFGDVIAATPDLALIATSSRDKATPEVKVYSTTDCSLICTLPHEGETKELVWHPNAQDRHLASWSAGSISGRSGTLQLWKIESAEKLYTISTPFPPVCFGDSPLDLLIAQREPKVAKDSVPKICRVIAAWVRFADKAQYTKKMVCDVAASAGQNRGQATGSAYCTPCNAWGRWEEDSLRSLVWVEFGSKYFRVWDFETTAKEEAKAEEKEATPESLPRPVEPITAGTFSPDGGHFATLGRASCHVWETSTGRHVATLSHEVAVPKPPPTEEELKAQEEAAMAAGLRARYGGRQVAEKTVGAVTDAVLGSKFWVTVSSDDHSARLWTTSGAPLKHLGYGPSPLKSVLISKDNRKVYAAEGEMTERSSGFGHRKELQREFYVRAWDWEQFNEADEAGTQASAVWNSGDTGSSITALLLIEDGAVIVCACEDGSVQLMDAATLHINRKLSGQQLYGQRSSGLFVSADSLRLYHVQLYHDEFRPVPPHFHGWALDDGSPVDMANPTYEGERRFQLQRLALLRCHLSRANMDVVLNVSPGAIEVKLDTPESLLEGVDPFVLASLATDQYAVAGGALAASPDGLRLAFWSRDGVVSFAHVKEPSGEAFSTFQQLGLERQQAERANWSRVEDTINDWLARRQAAVDGAQEWVSARSWWVDGLPEKREQEGVMPGSRQHTLAQFTTSRNKDAAAATRFIAMAQEGLEHVVEFYRDVRAPVESWLVAEKNAAQGDEEDSLSDKWAWRAAQRQWAKPWAECNQNTSSDTKRSWGPLDHEENMGKLARELRVWFAQPASASEFVARIQSLLRGTPDVVRRVIGPLRRWVVERDGIDEATGDWESALAEVDAAAETLEGNPHTKQALFGAKIGPFTSDEEGRVALQRCQVALRLKHKLADRESMKRAAMWDRVAAIVDAWLRDGLVSAGATPAEGSSPAAPQCPSGHPMLGPRSGGARCDGCGARAGCGHGVGLTCTKCDYDLCSECAEQRSNDTDKYPEKAQPWRRAQLRWLSTIQKENDSQASVGRRWGGRAAVEYQVGSAARARKEWDEMAAEADEEAVAAMANRLQGELRAECGVVDGDAGGN